MFSDNTVKKVLLEAAAGLRQQRVAEAPRLDAEVLMAHMLGVERLRLFLDPDRTLTPSQLSEFQKLIDERGKGKPVAYLTGYKEFMALEFRVGPGVLIPRPETELLVEEALRLEPGVVIDVGTGSGAIAVSVACFLSAVHVYAVDVSAAALVYARQNAADLGAAGQITFFQGYLLEPLQGLPVQADCITANLPYIPAGDKQNLPVDVRAYEPHQALFGGIDGLDLYRSLLPRAIELLAPGGVLLMEIGPGQALALAGELAKYKAFTRIDIKHDYAGLERIVRAETKR